MHAHTQVRTKSCMYVCVFGPQVPTSHWKKLELYGRNEQSKYFEKQTTSKCTKIPNSLTVLFLSTQSSKQSHAKATNIYNNKRIIKILNKTN